MMDSKSTDEQKALDALRRAIVESGDTIAKWIQTQTIGDGRLTLGVCRGLAIAIIKGEIKHLGLR